MTEAQQADLYSRIQAFEVEEEDIQTTFSMRLARENAWPVDYAHRVIEEYKKFAFLWIVPKPPIPRIVVAGVVAVALFAAGLYYANVSGKVANPVGGLLISGIGATAGFSLIQFLAIALDSLNRPLLPPRFRVGVDGVNNSGCAVRQRAVSVNSDTARWREMDLYS